MRSMSRLSSHRLVRTSRMLVRLLLNLAIQSSSVLHTLSVVSVLVSVTMRKNSTNLQKRHSHSLHRYSLRNHSRVGRKLSMRWFVTVTTTVSQFVTWRTSTHSASILVSLSLSLLHRHLQTQNIISSVHSLSRSSVTSVSWVSVTCSMPSTLSLRTIA